MVLAAATSDRQRDDNNSAGASWTGERRRRQRRAGATAATGSHASPSVGFAPRALAGPSERAEQTSAGLGCFSCIALKQRFSRAARPLSAASAAALNGNNSSPVHMRTARQPTIGRSVRTHNPINVWASEMRAATCASRVQCSACKLPPLCTVHSIRRRRRRRGRRCEQQRRQSLATARSMCSAFPRA